jgi:murein DD-endopeptidase MepM/ murein hydrolase activator NlpD
MTIRETSRFKRFVNGRGFYVALAACLLAVGGLAVATFGETLFVAKEGESSPDSQTKPVEQIVSDLPDDRKTTTTTTTVTTTTATTVAADLYILPFGNLVQKAYSDGKLAYSVTMGSWRTHDGVDFAGELGQKVKALADGKVTAIEEDPLWGTVITVDHGMGVVSRYFGVKASVKVGGSVKVGDVLGTLVAIPCESSEAPHLHLEMSIDGKAVDPVAAIGLEVRYTEEETTE